MRSEPLRAMGMREFARASVAEPYLRGRWVYLRHVARLIREIEPRSVLEIGPGPHPFVPGSDTLDVSVKYAPTCLYDAGDPGWPIATGAYDLVIGLQVWEHLGDRHGGRHQIAFREAMRVARLGVILSFPLMWREADARHRNISRDTIARWTCDAVPTETITVAKPKDRSRFIAYWKVTA